MSGLPTPTTIEALEEAIRMLEAIVDGRASCVTGIDFRARLAAIKEARDEHYRTQMKDERTRAQLRELSRRIRSAHG